MWLQLYMTRKKHTFTFPELQCKFLTSIHKQFFPLHAKKRSSLHLQLKKLNCYLIYMFDSQKYTRVSKILTNSTHIFHVAESLSFPIPTRSFLLEMADVANRS